MNRANLELVQPKFGRSFYLKHYGLDKENDKADFWHFHPELELVYVNGGNGVRHVGNHLSYYNNGDLVLIGSNLPHNGFTDSNTGNRSEVVVQFRSDFLGDSFLSVPEFEDIDQLFSRALNGLAFKGVIKDEIGSKLELLDKLSAFDALLELIKILKYLSQTKEYEILNATHYSAAVNKQDNDRAAKVFQFVRESYKSTIDLKDISALANMTVPSFCRYFKKLTGKTFTVFVNEFRIIEACRLISEKELLISTICYEVGFNNFAHFSKHFKLVTGKSPSAYRKEHTSLMRL